MATISPVRAAARPLPFVLAVSLLLGGALGLDGDPLPAVAATVVCAVVMGAVVGQAPARLARRLDEFAGQVPGEPEVSIAWHGAGTLEWPDLGLTVEGNVHRYRLQDVTVHVGQETRFPSATRPREAARAALDELGEEPALAGPEDRLPSLYPREAGLLTGVLAAVLAGSAVGLGGPLVAGGVYPLWWWWLVPVAGVVAGLVRWLGLAHVRRALRSLAAELGYAGTEVGTVDRTGGRLRLTFAVRTTDGSVPVRCLAVPYGRMTATHPTDSGENASTRLPDPGPMADRIATWRRRR